MSYGKVLSQRSVLEQEKEKQKEGKGEGVREGEGEKEGFEQESAYQ